MNNPKITASQRVAAALTCAEERTHRRLLARERIAPGRAVLVEDTVSHLKGARALGMRTVWVTGYLAKRPGSQQHASAHPALRRGVRPGYVDVKLKSVMGLPGQLRRLG